MKKQPIGMKINPDLLLEVDVKAEAEKRSRSSMIEILLGEAIEARALVKESETVPRVPA